MHFSKFLVRSQVRGMTIPPRISVLNGYIFTLNGFYYRFGFESERRMCNWINRKGLPRTTSVLDIGCGNGSMLLALHKLGFSSLTGIDYSQAAVSLATKVARDKSANTINYYLADISSPKDHHGDCPQIFGRTFDLCIDKGTYDAVCLSPDDSREKRLNYAKNILRILSYNGIFVITSCNWTKGELIAQFTGMWSLRARKMNRRTKLESFTVYFEKFCNTVDRHAVRIDMWISTKHIFVLIFRS